MEKRNKTISIRCGQVWKSKNSNSRVVILAVSHKSSKVFVCGVIDEVDPEFTTDYLIEAYNLDGDYRQKDYIAN